MNEYHFSKEELSHKIRGYEIKTNITFVVTKMTVCLSGVFRIGPILMIIHLLDKLFSRVHTPRLVWEIFKGKSYEWVTFNLCHL